MSQPVFATVAATTKQTLFSWETGKTAPDGFQLAAIAAAGADVLYILTGERDGPPPVVLTGEEQLLLNYYRDAPAAMRKAAMAVLLSAGHAPAGQLYQGDGGVQIGSVAGGRVRVGKK